MAVKTIASVKADFVSGAVPTESQYIDLIDSTYTGEALANVASAAAIGSTGLINITDASSASFEAAGSAGLALVAASTQASARTAIGAGSAGAAVFQADTQASARTAIDVTAATTAKAGLIEIATTAEGSAGTDTNKAITPAVLAAAAPGVLQRGTPTSAAGTSVDLTGIPSGTQRVHLGFNDVGFSSSSGKVVIVQLGDSGGFESSSYFAAVQTSAFATAATVGFLVANSANFNTDLYGAATFILMDDNNTWAMEGGLYDSNLGDNFYSFGGVKSLSDELTQIRVTTIAASGSFNDGTLNISYD